MKQILGKIIFLYLITINLFAQSVKLELNTPAIYQGDMASFTIKASGEDIKFPDIKEIDGFTIIGVSNSSSTTIINGKVDKTISKTYSFQPLKDVVIPSYIVQIDSNEYKTKENKIKVLKPTQSKKGDDFIVKLKVSNAHIKVGQSTKLTVVFKRRIDAKADNLSVNEPHIENFWIKKIDDVKKYTQGNYLVQEFSYLLFGQKSGVFKIDQIEANIGTIVHSSYNGGFNDPFFNSFNTNIKWKKIYSNSVTITVDSLPNGIELYGEFNISSKVDKTIVYLNQPVNLTIKIDGIGNIDDIKKYDFSVKNCMVYPDKPKITAQLIKDKYIGQFVQKIAIVGDKDFTIPSLKLIYFDKITKKVKTIQTQPIDIKVNGTENKTQITPVVQTMQKPISKEKIVYKTIKQENKYNYYYFILGFISGGFLVFMIFLKKNGSKQKNELPIVVLIKKAKKDKELFDILLPYANEYTEVQQILKLLEENIYKDANHKIDKQKLYDIFL